MLQDLHARRSCSPDGGLLRLGASSRQSLSLHAHARPSTKEGSTPSSYSPTLDHPLRPSYSSDSFVPPFSPPKACTLIPSLGPPQTKGPANFPSIYHSLLPRRPA